MPPKVAAKEPAKEVSLGPQVGEGELVFGVVSAAVCRGGALPADG